MIGIDTVIEALAFGAFLWLSLYILSRANRRDPQSIITFLALLSMAVFFFYNGYIASSRDTINLLLVRALWWSNLLPVAVWLHISYQMARNLAPPVLSLPMIINYAAVVVMALLGSFTDLYLDYSHPQINPTGEIQFLAGPLFWTYIVYVAVALGAALFFIRRRLSYVQNPPPHAPERDSVRMHQLLILGGSLFLAGALYLTLQRQFAPQWWYWPGILILLAGLSLVAYNVAFFKMMVVGQNSRREFAYGLTGALVVNLVWLGLLWLVGAVTAHSLFVIVGLATATVTLYDLGQQLLDRLFFSQAEQQARSEGRAYVAALASTPLTSENAANLTATEEGPDPEDEKNFNNIVRRSITHLKNPTQLVKSQLLSLRLVERRLKEAGLDDNRLNRAAVLREVLVEYIERLRPEGLSDRAGSEPGTGDGWRFYNVLYFPYVREISRKTALSEARRLELERKRAGLLQPGDLEQVLNWLTDVDEATFYKWQRRASDTIATLLREEELGLTPANSVSLVNQAAK